MKEWWKVAAYMKYNPNIQLFQIEWTKNEVLDLNVRTLPNMFFYAFDNKD